MKATSTILEKIRSGDLTGTKQTGFITITNKFSNPNQLIKTYKQVGAGDHVTIQYSNNVPISSFSNKKVEGPFYAVMPNEKSAEACVNLQEMKIIQHNFILMLLMQKTMILDSKTRHAIHNHPMVINGKENLIDVQAVLLQNFKIGLRGKGKKFVLMISLGLKHLMLQKKWEKLLHKR